MKEWRNVQKILVEKPEGKRSLGRYSRRWEEIKMNIKETDYESVNWIHLALDKDSAGLF